MRTNERVCYPATTMPRIAHWRKGITKIREEVEAAELPVFHREDIESFFGVKRRQAQQLLQTIGETFDLGRSKVVTRASLLAFLERTEADGQEVGSIATSAVPFNFLGELKQLPPPVIIPAPPSPLAGALPDGAVLEPGNRLVLTYASADDLLVKLAGVIQAADLNPGWFLCIVENEGE